MEKVLYVRNQQLLVNGTLYTSSIYIEWGMNSVKQITLH